MAESGGKYRKLSHVVYQCNYHIVFVPKHVVEVLERLKATRALPKRISVANGPEFTSRVVELWAYRSRIELDFSRPGTPTDNPFIEGQIFTEMRKEAQ